MNTFEQCVEKLSVLLATGHITQAEFNNRRKKLLDEFIGTPGVAGSTATAGIAPRASYAAPPPLTRRLSATPAFQPRLPTVPRLSTVPRRSFGAAAIPLRSAPSLYTPVPAVRPVRSLAKPVSLLPRPVAFSKPGPVFGATAQIGATAAPVRTRGAYTKPAGAAAGRFSPYPRSGPRGAITAVKVQPIPDGTSVEELKAIFMGFGQIVTASVNEGQPRHGYVNFATPAEAQAAAAVQEVIIHGESCLVTPHYRARPPVAEGEPTNGIGIFNLPFSMTQDEVEAMMQQFPGYQVVKYVTNKFGNFRGYIFAYFDSVENAAAAKESLLGLPIGDKTLDVKFSNRSAEEAFTPVEL